jgi:predicted nuclease of predicted toxin-antitoxin system
LRILFDQNVPRALGRYLEPHPVTRSAERDWQELKNGDLIETAESASFDLLVTCDQNLEHQQTVAGRRVAILALSTNNWPLLRVHAAEIAEAVSLAMPGTYRFLQCGTFRRARKTVRRADSK